MQTSILAIFFLMVALFFLVVFLWVFIANVTDIFRRQDVSGWAKAGRILLIVVLPLLGCLIYVVARPTIVVE